MKGCARRCVYCDQDAITGERLPNIERARTMVGELSEPVEICFFGGSFTCLPDGVMLDWLSIVDLAPPGSTIRFSTHPHCITAPKIEIFSRFPISIVELGVSSLDDDVLRAANRGYKGDDVLCVIECLLKEGYDVCAQMMIGLPGQTLSSAMRDLELLDKIRGENTLSIRIYPCLVLSGTPLAKMDFSPLSVEEAAEQAGELLYSALRMGFHIIRIGLHETDSLSQSVIAGPHHPALGEIAWGNAFVKLLHDISPCGDWFVERRHTSLLTGHGNLGIKKLASLSGLSVDSVRSKLKFF